MKANSWQELALHIVHTRRAQYDAYQADVDDWYRKGDGRPYDKGGKGYTYPYCIHGVSRWVDYDCACGPCEDGDGYWDYVRELSNARYEAKHAFEEMQRRLTLAVSVMNQKDRHGNAVFDIDHVRVNNWLIEPVSK